MKTQERAFSWLVLLTSFSTLFCCVLPALFVLLGFGSVVASVVGAFPQITWLSEHKQIVFALATVLVLAAGLRERRRQFEPCPTDPALARACGRLRRFSLILWAISALTLAGSALFVFVLPRFIN